MNTNLLQTKLDGMTRQQKIQLILTLLAHEGKKNSADEFRALVVGMLGTFVNGMSDADFKSFCAVHRCDIAGCDCHVIAEAAGKFFTLLREDVKKELSRRSNRLN